MGEDIRKIEWDFRPYFPVRKYDPETQHFARENIYVRRWQRMMTRHALDPFQEGAVMSEDEWFIDNESRRYPILDIFGGYKPSAHDTRIASNFILFLGKGLGLSYLDQAEKLSDVFAQAHMGKGDAYLAQWGLMNAPAHLLPSNTPARYDFTQSAQKDMFFSPDYRDIKTLERMAYWCGKDQGQAFIKKCELHIKAVAKRVYPPETQEHINRRQKIGQHFGIPF